MIKAYWYNDSGVEMEYLEAVDQLELNQLIAENLLDDGKWGTFGEPGDRIEIKEEKRV